MGDDLEDAIRTNAEGPASASDATAGRAALLQRAAAPDGQNPSSPAKTSPLEVGETGENGAERNRRKSKENRRLATTGHHLSSLTVDESAGAPPGTRTPDPLIKS